MKKYHLDWINYMNAYRLYDEEAPQNTMAYEDTLEDAIKNLSEYEYIFNLTIDNTNEF